MLSGLFKGDGEPSAQEHTPLLGRPNSRAFVADRYESSAESDIEDDQSSDPFQPRRRSPNPLLPIFSAQHLGSYPPGPVEKSTLTLCRQDTRVSSPASHQAAGRAPMRDDPVVGPAAHSANIAVPRQAHPAGHPRRTLLPGDAVCPLGELPAIPERCPAQPGLHRRQPHESHDMRAAGHASHEGVFHARGKFDGASFARC
jgi:hypothetical protein